MHFFRRDQLARVLLQQYRFARGEFEQLNIGCPGGVFMLQRLAQNVADAVLVGFQQRADGKRRMSAEVGDEFARLLRVEQALRASRRNLDRSEGKKESDHFLLSVYFF